MEIKLKENVSALVIAHHEDVGSVTSYVVSGGFYKVYKVICVMCDNMNGDTQ